MTGKSDLLSLFMGIKDSNGNGLDDQSLCDYVLNFMIAGRDTTAVSFSKAKTRKKGNQKEKKRKKGSHPYIIQLTYIS